MVCRILMFRGLCLGAVVLGFRALGFVGFCFMVPLLASCSELKRGHP